MDEQFKQIRDLIMERDGALRTHIDERFTQIDERFTQIEERDRLLRLYVEGRFNQIHEYIDERTHDMETRLLKGFQKWATSIELTIKPMPIRMGSLEERLSLLEERWKDIGNSGA